MTVTEDLLPFRDPGFRSDPYPYYARLREEHPVYKHPLGLYVVSRYEDVARLIRNPTLSVQQLDFGVADPIHHTMLGKDAPDHTRLRRITNRWFTPKAVEEWSKVMRASVEAVLDEVEKGDGTLDAADGLALKCTFDSICHIFGIEPTDMLAVQRKTYEIGLSLGPGGDDEEAKGTAEALEWFAGHIRRLLADKRANPGEGMIDAFIAAQDEGRMTEDEVIYTIFLFFAVGHLDVKHLINHGIWLMTQRPDLFAVYRDDPEARPGIINEILRIDTPESMVVRLTTQDTVIGDTTVPAGEVLALLIASANRDPAVFADPDTFDHTRPVAAGQHLAFGSGMHGCAGQVLARAEADVVFTALVHRFSGVELAGEPAYAHTEFLRTVTHLPVRFR
ncbi:cytochrome P450 [Streptomyces justiciae]|uniref:cytochrome P450 n=1 Tax=Streptomyces justiciae TaxID=2780140 RepID=UPI001881504F|nr:cytochrome P450 [Streptomyces justiciae]MBE8477617.1 cytochrome P450 [Streptomyces justiciae]MCW8380741.1 cytochrome P450 [Streptomyces justiciae]